MADINKFVKELWQRTYRNQDIDYIQARGPAAGPALRPCRGPGAADADLLVAHRPAQWTRRLRVDLPLPAALPAQHA